MKIFKYIFFILLAVIINIPTVLAGTTETQNVQSIEFSIELDEFIKIKQENYNYYNEIGVELLPFRKDIFSNYWFYSYLTSGPEERDEMIKYMGENNIQTRPIWSLIHKQKPYQNCQAYDIEKAIFYQDRIVNLPCSTSLTKDDIEIVVSCIKNRKEV